MPNNNLIEGEVKKVHIDTLKPYWCNPRDNTKTVGLLKESILENGYQQFICVDPNNVIITGHARFKALKELGYEQISVIVADLPAKQAKKFRLIDNSISEFTEWTPELTLEIREIGEMEVMQKFFKNDINLHMEKMTQSVQITGGDVSKIKVNLDNRYATAGHEDGKSIQDIICPECGHEFKAVLNTIPKKLEV